MKTSLFYLPSIGSKQEMLNGRAGLRPDLYQKMLAGIAAQARQADALGYESINFTEHHLHVEGFEISQNPVMLDLFVAMQTTRIRVGQLGIVLPAENPIRVAENIAMLDHMSGGRANAGFARGYQRRWVDTIAQHMHGVHGALPGRHDDIDAANRAAFEEAFRVVKRCWTEDLIAHDGKTWKLPVDGTPWTVPLSAQAGAGIEDGIVKQIGVVPKPLQKPHPPLFQPFATSERSITWCASETVTAVLPPMHAKREEALTRVYAEASGRPLGDGVAYLRDILVCETEEEALHWWQESSRWAAEVWFEPFGFRQGMKDPDTGEFPPREEVLAGGYVLVGTVDSVTRRLETMLERMPWASWVFGWMFNAMVPDEINLRSLELYATKVLPRLGLAHAAD
jgi:alkanesulfonate monooxygenase SsuD/methylene tetrahydromethanopterin reductase-like flavin-dependent oxidoreductase (luciferase family)